MFYEMLYFHGEFVINIQNFSFLWNYRFFAQGIHFRTGDVQYRKKTQKLLMIEFPRW